MDTWPNWVDLIVVIVLIRTCYSGFNRGILAEMFSLIGSVAVVVLTSYVAGYTAQWLLKWFQVDPTLTTFLLFWGLFIGIALLIRKLLKYLAELVTWERLNWFSQGVGLLLGAVRGIWWVAVILVAVSSTGVPALERSVQERSVVGSQFLTSAHDTINQVSSQFPGIRDYPRILFPPFKVGAR